jgi:hypothetical protein
MDQSSSNEPIGNKEERKVQFWQRSPINIISPICFQLNHWKMAKTTAQQRLKLKFPKPVEALM